MQLVNGVLIIAPRGPRTGAAISLDVDVLDLPRLAVRIDHGLDFEHQPRLSRAITSQLQRNRP